MEKQYTEDLNTDGAIRLAVQTLGEIVEGSEHLDICCMHQNGKIETVAEETVA
jgi:20S proteasome alpha/beta subunit